MVVTRIGLKYAVERFKTADCQDNEYGRLDPFFRIEQPDRCKEKESVGYEPDNGSANRVSIGGNSAPRAGLFIRIQKVQNMRP
jgi:hypothetical protein